MLLPHAQSLCPRRKLGTAAPGLALRHEGVLQREEMLGSVARCGADKSATTSVWRRESPGFPAASGMELAFNAPSLPVYSK